MRWKNWIALLSALLLLSGCAFLPFDISPAPTREPGALTWLHAYYADASYSQLALTDQMDAVSLGWAQLRLNEAGEPWVDKATGVWTVPAGAETVTDYLAQRDIPYNLCVYATASDAVEGANGETRSTLAWAISPENRPAAVRELVAAAEGYSGLTLDFEGLKPAEEKENFSALVAELRDALPADKLLYAAVPPDRWYKGYDYRALGEACDKVILMAHDYQWTRAPEGNLGTANTDTPLAPIDRVEEALAHFTDPKTGVRDLSRAAIAVAFSCAGVKVDEEGLLLDTKVYNPGTAILTRRLAQEDAELGWSEEYQSPYVYYHDEDGNRYRLWYEDSRSLAAKAELARRYGVTGLSLWRLGSIPDDPEVYDAWSEILLQTER